MKKTQSSDYFNLLEKALGIDEEGNITAGKNLEADGNIFTLNGKQWGIMPVFKDIDNVITSIGYILYSDKPKIFSPAPNITVFKCRGIYLDETGKVYIFSYYPGGDYSIEKDILYIKSNESYDLFIKTAFSMELAEAEIGQIKNKQNKLYRHVISLEAIDNSNNVYRGSIIYETTSSLKVDSLQDLTTLLKPTAGYNYPISGVVTKANEDQIIELSVMRNLQFDIDVWQFYGDDNSYVNITAVSDIVTPL